MAQARLAREPIDAAIVRAKPAVREHLPREPGAFTCEHPARLRRLRDFVWRGVDHSSSRLILSEGTTRLARLISHLCHSQT